MTRVNLASTKSDCWLVFLVAITAHACSNVVAVPKGSEGAPQINHAHPGSQPSANVTAMQSVATAKAPQSHPSEGTTAKAPQSHSSKGTTSEASTPRPVPIPPLHDVDLLQVTPARVAVSSAVRNPHDFPEYLVDNHLDTAWNSKTGDLVGGWIAFRIPADATIHRIEMTAGYARTQGTKDLFTANHRISQIEVFRDGQSLGTFALDPKIRGLQVLPISGNGADYQLVVRATVPGTNRAWKELVVSELHVIGDPGNALRAPKEPLGVAIGSLENNPANDFGLPVRTFDPDPKAYSSLSEVCQAFISDARANEKETLERLSGIGIDHVGKPSCEILKTTLSLPTNELYRHLNALRIDDGVVRSTTLVVEVARGYVPLPVYYSQEDPTDPGCPSFFRANGIQAPRVENGHLIITLNSRQLDWANENNKPSYYQSHGAVWCKEDNSSLTCHDYIPNMTSSLAEFTVDKEGNLRIQGEGL
jgi:hypothetical protein